MEDVFTIRVKSKPEKKDLYPSERRYSASTVSGLAWVHITLAATCFLLSCLTFINPIEEPVQQLTVDETTQKNYENFPIFNQEIETTTQDYFEDNVTESYDNTAEEVNNNYDNYLLVIASCFVCCFALVAAITAGNAALRWYVDKNITWFFIASVLSSIFSLISCVLITVWLFEQPEKRATINQQSPIKGFYSAYRYAIVHRNVSHILLTENMMDSEDVLQINFKQRVLAINILVAATLEFLWSLLSVKISYKGMKSDYQDEETGNPNKVSVVTKIKGNKSSLSSKTAGALNLSHLANHHPTNKNINQVYLANNENGYYLRTAKENANSDTEKAEYNDRINDYLKRRNSIESSRQSFQTEASETKKNSTQNQPKIEISSPDLTKIGWDDTLERGVFNQNNINLDAIFNNYMTKEEKDKVKSVKPSENVEK